MAGKMSAADLAAYVGALVAIIGLLITWFYKREADKLRRADDARREREFLRRDAERQLRMDLMRATGAPTQHYDTDLGVLEVDE